MKQISVRIPDDLHALIVAAATEDQRSINSQILWLIQQGLVSRRSV